jgi:hypothetical protein
MKDTYYFSHDYNARSDVKIKRLIAKHGYLGYGIYWAIVEDLYQNANALPLECESIAFDLRTQEDIVESIIKDFDLFVIEGNEFGSMSVERRLDQRAERSNKARESANLRWAKHANALRTQSEGNAIKERKEKETKEKEISLSGKPDYAHIFKGWVKFINQTFDRQFTTAAWEKKTLPKIKQLLKDYKTKENLAEALITVCKNIAKDTYHIETNFKYVTPEYIARPDIFDKHLNTISKVDAKQSERWQKPEDIYLCVDWIDKIPCPPKDLNGDEAAMFMYVWRISELMHYQQDRQGVHSNLSEHAEF